MSSLTLELIAQTNQRIDAYGVVPDRLMALDITSISTMPIAVGGQTCELGELFRVHEGGRNELHWTGSLENVDRLGGSMRDGRMIVHGCVGNQLAEHMSGGSLLVRGSAGEFTSAGQRGGSVTIEGDVGDHCASSVSGARRGMRGGFLYVSGSAGRFVGNRMRRGIVCVQGNVDYGCAAYMIAGTILVLGNVASPLAIGMKRGSIICKSNEQPELHAGFTEFETTKLSYLPVLMKHIQSEIGSAAFHSTADPTCLRALGDRASGGQGEILWMPDR